MGLAIGGANRYGPADFRTSRTLTCMAQNRTPHFHNTQGLPRIEIGAKEFQCIGAIPPFDHPHVFLDMGADTEIVCPYCSTLYVFAPELPAGLANPASAVFTVEHA